jgi:hypothetical protein
MEVTIKISNEIAARAKARGIRVESYIQEILAQHIRSAETHTPRTSTEIQAWLDAIAQFSDKIPPLPDTISRDWLYRDHI